MSELAEELGVCTKTVRNHLPHLAALKLAYVAAGHAGCRGAVYSLSNPHRSPKERTKGIKPFELDDRLETPPTSQPQELQARCEEVGFPLPGKPVSQHVVLEQAEPLVDRAHAHSVEVEPELPARYVEVRDVQAPLRLGIALCAECRGRPGERWPGQDHAYCPLCRGLPDRPLAVPPALIEASKLARAAGV